MIIETKYDVGSKHTFEMDGEVYLGIVQSVIYKCGTIYYEMCCTFNGYSSPRLYVISENKVVE